MAAGEGSDDMRAFVRAFWRELDSLRRERGMSYKQLERRTKIACSTLQYWMTRSGRLLPWVQVRAVVLALEAPEELWFDRWKQADHKSALNGHPAINSGEFDGDEPLSGATVAARAQLPMDIREFTGREGELRQLREALSPDDGATAVPVSVITGMAGIGKTRLAVHVAHQLRRWFRLDDLQLYVDMRGHCPAGAPADPAATLGAFLRLLGVHSGDIPGDVDARAALYRDRMDGKRAIVVLDNAADEHQVQPLLPGSPTCRVLVTSRRKLTGLDGMWPLTLGLFSLEEALALLAMVAGGERVLAERAAAEEIVRCCGHLPLAVALAARRLQARPAWTLADLAELLGIERRRLGELAVGNRAVRTVFDTSYGRLSGEQRRIFRLLGLHPGHDFTAHSAASLVDIPPERAKALLESLLDEHLLDQTTCGRYRFHGLMHSYARERADDEETADGGIEAVRRLLVWYLHTAESASRALAPGVRRFPLDSAGVPDRYVVHFGTREQALAWCDAEHANLAAAVRVASRRRFDLLAWRLAAALLGFFRLRKHWDEWIATFTVAVGAARRLDDAIGEATLLDGLAMAYCELRRFPESHECLQRALSLYRRSGDRMGESQVLNDLGEAHASLGEVDRAVESYRRALTLRRSFGDRYGQAQTLHNLGLIFRSSGRDHDAVDCFRQAAGIRREVGDPWGLADALESHDDQD